MISTTFIRAAVFASAITISGYVFAQGPQMQHHGGGAGSMKPMPMGDGMMPGQMRGRGMMMGKGMMGGGMMGRNCPMMGMMMNSEGGETHTAGRIAFLKAELGITKEQQGAFDAYASALKKNLDDMQGMRSKMMSAMQSGTPVERLSSHITVMEDRLATLKEVKPALEKLYGALSDDQKKKANEIIGGIGCMM